MQLISKALLIENLNTYLTKELDNYNTPNPDKKTLEDIDENLIYLEGVIKGIRNCIELVTKEKL